MLKISHIYARNVLSFGPDGLDLPLTNLNVLIGPNGSGKSNLIELFALMSSLPMQDSLAPIRQGGGIREWIWKGGKAQEFSVSVVHELQKSVTHVVTIHNGNGRSELLVESIEDEAAQLDTKDRYFYKYDRNSDEFPILHKKSDDGNGQLDKDLIKINQSILAQLRDSLSYPELSQIADNYDSIRLYREWSFGRTSEYRKSQSTDQRNDRLLSDCSNLGLVLSRLRKDPTTKRALIKALQDLYADIEDFEVFTEANSVQIYLQERDYSISAMRLSDGTLRYLCLLAILLDPKPAAVTCIEEPEMGLHPDIIPKLAELLVSASGRTQLIVTTHSDILIDALSDHPESVLVCEKTDGQTSIERLKKEELSHWLEKYRLGQLWLRGEIGGTRW
jgi:predicted ATPase